MSPIRRLARLRLSTDARDRQILQYVYFAAAPVLFVVAIRGVTRFASTPFEILLGILAASILALLMVVAGLILPLTARRDA